MIIRYRKNNNNGNNVYGYDDRKNYDNHNDDAII